MTVRDSVWKARYPRVLFRCLGTFCQLTLMILTSRASLAANSVPSPDRLLSDDTLFVLTAPDFSKLRDLFRSSPEAQFWNDPAIRPFRDNFIAKWRQDVVKPLARELNLQVEEFLSLAQGQVTFAVTQNGWTGKPDEAPGILLLVDTGTKSLELKTNLTQLRRRWSASGKTMRTEKIRDCDLMMISLSSNDLPKTLRQFLPQGSDIQDLGADGETHETKPPKADFIIGQSGSLLLVGNVLTPVEKVLARKAGSEVPALADLAAFHADYIKRFRDAPLYAWVNVKRLMNGMEQGKGGGSVDPIAPPSADKMFTALGLDGVTSGAFTFHAKPEGQLFEVFVAAPESTRRGIFKLLEGTPKDATPPPFVPSDAVKFERWRVNARDAWTTCQKMQNAVSGQGAGLDGIIESAAVRARDKDPGYDLRKALFSNLSDDFITWEKTPRGTSASAMASPPSILLLGSPEPEKLAGALKVLFGVLAGTDAATEREFLGHRIFTTPFPGLPIPLLDTSRMMGKSLSYAAVGGYVALSSDDSMIGELLRSAEGQGRGLRETPGLGEAVERVTGPNTDLFGVENRMETLRIIYEAARKHPASITNAPPANPNSFMASVPLAGPDRTIKEWMDFSLLPPFERVSKYFYFEVYGGSSTVDGLTWKQFAPTPPALREAAGSAK